jgi:hypothetical protein
VRGFLAAGVIASAVLGALAGGGAAAPPSTSAGVVWSAGMETGDLSEWSRNDTDGGSWDSGDCDRPPNGVSTAVAHTGRYSMAMTIDTSDGEAGCRQARYEESKRDRAYYYGAWLYLPRYTRAEEFWNIVQFKSKEEGEDGSDPFWVIDLMPRRGGVLALRLRWKGLVDGPFSGQGEDRRVWSRKPPLRIPIRRWFHIEVFLRPSDSHEGRITVWQDGVLLWDFDRVKTRYEDGDTRWTVNNYSDELVPRRATLFVDDATIGRCRAGPSPGARTECAGR